MKFKFRRYYLYYWARLGAMIVGMIPLRPALVLAAAAGRLVYAVLPKYRRIALDNLRHAFRGEKTEHEIRAIARSVFENIAKCGVELLHFPELTPGSIGRLVTMRRVEVLKEAFRKGNGVIILTAHFGNWELLALALRLNGYPGVAIGRRIYFHKYDAFLNSLRRTGDVNIIYRDESPKKALRVLRENRIVGVLPDQDVDAVSGVFIDFFGRPAYTPVGPVLLARASGAVIVPTFIVRDREGHHTLTFEDPITLVDTGDKGADAIENTRRWSHLLETYIRRHPDQWVWIHRRWKTQEKR